MFHFANEDLGVFYKYKKERMNFFDFKVDPWNILSEDEDLEEMALTK